MKNHHDSLTSMLLSARRRVNNVCDGVSISRTEHRKHRKCITVLIGRKWFALVKKKKKRTWRASVIKHTGDDKDQFEAVKLRTGIFWKILKVGRTPGFSSAVIRLARLFRYARFAPTFPPPTTTRYYPIRFTI